MEVLGNIINELESQKSLLLEEKGANLQLIEEYESKICYYKNLYNYYLSLCNVKESQKNGYKNILDYCDDSVNLSSYNMFNGGYERLIKQRIAEISSEISSISERKRVCFYLYDYYKGRKTELETQNESIDKRVSEIDKEIFGINGEEKVYKLERGN